MSSLISADATWELWAVLFVAAAIGLVGERTRIGSRLSGAVIAIGTTFLLSNLGVIPVEAPVYDVVWSYFVPLAIPLLLFRADLARIIREAGPTLLAFVAGGFGTVIGTVIAFHVVPLGDEAAKLAGIFCATYVGGSMNYVAAAEALGLESAELLTAGIAADNLVMTLYFLVLFALPAFGPLARALPEREINTEGDSDVEFGPPPTLIGMTTAVALSATICAVGFWAGNLIGWKGSGILVITAITVVLATALPKKMATIGGASELGTLLMQVFFAAIGAAANIGVVVRVGSKLFVFAALILTIHLIVLLIAGRLLKLDLRECVIASNANMGGPTTAAAMAVARRWNGLVIPAILCGTLGYATGTFVGVAVGGFLGGP